MNHPVQPTTVAPPAASYALAVGSPAGSRFVHTSGIVPIGPSGAVPDSVGEQARTVWHAIGEILGADGMVLSDIVSITTYLVSGSDAAPVMAARDEALDGHLAASTLVYVPALVRPEWKVEIAVVAARSVG